MWSGRLHFFLGASGALTHALLRWPIPRGSTVVCSNVTYHCVRDLLASRCRRAGATLTQVDFPFPCTSPDEVLRVLKSRLQELCGSVLSLVVLDHISSKPAILFPAREMVATCRAHGAAAVVVDGAHAAGQLAHVCVDDIDADAYIGNTHKWLYSPVSCGYLVERRAGHSAMRDSHGGKALPVLPPLNAEDVPSTYEFEAVTQGVYAESTRDYSALLSLPACVLFREALGGAVAVHDHCHGTEHPVTAAG